MTAPTLLTPAQRKLARHALGLPNDRKRSYRNRFVSTVCPGNYDHWCAMTDAGLAIAGPTQRNGIQSLVTFWLTKIGADAALEPGESLDPEDFSE